MRSMLRCIALLTVAVFGCAFPGCGIKEIRLPDTGADLSGTVTYNGEKVMVALIIVQGAGASATGNIGDDGSFTIKNVPLGEVNIAVNTEAGKGELKGKMMARAQTKQKLEMPKIIDVPSKYFSPASSGIKTTINKGSNKYDVVIKK
ncbi:MAG TPA: hypothetical protein VGP68_12210 [Gemmataceae bacterium]|jgi:hypothetical protein|nr:hypothetical protein [Gemmataceae bacterium]